MASKKNILVVEDSSSVLKLLVSALGSAGFELHAACDGHEALGILQGASVDLIISDLNMPGMDGAELVSNVRGLSGHRFTPFIVLSGEQDNDKKVHARKLGASAWLNKPFKTEQLLKVVQMVIG